MRNAKFIWLVVGVIVILGIFLLRSQKQTDEIVYETVNFCGTEYQVEKIVIAGVDIIKRIAEVASAEKNQETCKNIISADPQNLKISITERPNLDSLHLNGYLFDIDLKRRIIMRPGEHGIEDWTSLWP